MINHEKLDMVIWNVFNPTELIKNFSPNDLTQQLRELFFPIFAAIQNIKKDHA
jgi:hypothetical protein